MNIAVVTSEFLSEANFDGGLANYTYKLCKWLKQKGHDVTVFLTGHGKGRSTYEDINIIKVEAPDLKWQYKYRFERFKVPFLMNKTRYYYLGFEAVSIAVNEAIASQHAQKPFDVVHYPHVGGMALHRPENIPGVVRLSSSTQLCNQFGGYGEPERQVKAQEQIEIKAMKRATTVFGPSKIIASITEPVIGRKIEIIETPFIAPSASEDLSIYKQALEGKRYVLFFGSISLIKGVGTIAKMVHDLLASEPDLHFVFAGKKVDNTINNKPLWDHLIEKAGAHSNRIVHIPPQKHNTLFPIIEHAELVLLPSLTDNFPNTCIEAMAKSKIVIGTNGNGFEQLIADGESGFLVPVDNAAVLLEKIKQALHLPAEKRKAIELAAKKRIDLLSPDIVLGQVLNLYQKASLYKN